MRNRLSDVSFAISPVIIGMLWYLKYVLMPLAALHVQSDKFFVFGWVALGLTVLPCICLVNEIKKSTGINLELIDLLGIIAVLWGCAHWALIVQGGLGNVAGLIVVLGGLI